MFLPSKTNDIKSQVSFLPFPLLCIAHIIVFVKQTVFYIYIYIYIYIERERERERNLFFLAAVLAFITRCNRLKLQ